MQFQQKRHYYIWWCKTTLFRLSYATANSGFSAGKRLFSCEYLIRILRRNLENTIVCEYLIINNLAKLANYPNFAKNCTR